MPNWCSNYIEIKSSKFKNTISRTLNQEKLATMLFLLKNADFFGITLKTPFQDFILKSDSFENIKEVEAIFNKTPLAKINKDQFPLITALINHVVEQIQGRSFQNYCHHHLSHQSIDTEVNNIFNNLEAPLFIDKASFSLFNYIERPLSLYLAENHQFLVTSEEIGGLDVIGTNRELIGTKWDCSGENIEIEDDIVKITFDTAWSPPLPVIAILGLNYTKDGYLKFVYAEQGGGFCGQDYFENNELISNQESSLYFEGDDEDDCEYEEDATPTCDAGIDLSVLQGNYGG